MGWGPRVGNGRRETRREGWSRQEGLPSAFLPNGEGLFRFTTVAEAAAAAALAAVNADYERHCRAARALAETWFDATRTMRSVLEATVG